MPKGGFLEDYSGIAGAGSAFQGFAKGFQDAQDHQLKRQEMDAKMKAHSAQVERDAVEMALKKRQLDPMVQRREEMLKLASSNQNPVYGADGEISGTAYKPEYVAMQKEKADAVKGSNTVKTESGLREDWNKDSITKATKEVESAYSNMVKNAASKTAAGDMSTIFAYMKILDPSSTVREGEYASAKNAAGVPDKIREAYEKARTGTILTPTQRTDFLSQAKKIYENRRAAQARFDKSLTGVARRSGVNPKNVVLSDVFQAPDDKGLVGSGLVSPGLTGPAVNPKGMTREQKIKFLEEN